MSVAIPLKHFTSDQLNKLRLDLTHKSKASQLRKQLTIIEAFKYMDKNGNIIDDYKKCNIKNDSILVPLVYAHRKLKLEDNRPIKYVQYNYNTRSFRDGQQEVFLQAVDILKTTKSAYLQLHCGWGKTWCGLNIIAEMNLRTLVIYHRTFLGDQWMSEAEGIIPKQAKFITDNNVSDETKGTLFFCTVDRAEKLPYSFRKTIDFLVTDEAKYFCTPTRVNSMMLYQPKYSLGLCAERERQDGLHTLLDMFWGDIIFRKSAKPFIVWKYKTEIKPDIVRPKWGQARVDWNIVMDSLCNNEERNIKIRDICRLFGGGKIMVLCKRVDHVEKLAEMLKACDENVDVLYGNKKGFKNCRILIATYAKAEIGFDDKNLCEDFDGERLSLLIIAADKQEIEQSVGRVMRSENPKVIHIVDDMGTLEKHWGKCAQWYKSRNGQIQPVEYI